MARMLALVAVGAVALTIGAAPAAGDPTPLNTAYSAAAKVVPSPPVTSVITTGGLLGGLLGVTVPMLNAIVAPLASSLTSLPTTVVNTLATLTGSNYEANSSSVPTAAPASGYPDCTANGWDVGNCYGPLVPAATAPGVLSLSNGALQGYATADPTGSYSKARVAGVNLSVLGLPIGNLGTSESSAACNQAGVCSTTSSLVGASLLGGAVQVRTDTAGNIQVSVNNQPFVSLSALATANVTSPGTLGVAVSAVGTAVQLKIGLSLNTLLGALGTALNLGANGTLVDSAVTLTLRLGTGTTTTSTNGVSHGLELSLGLGVALTVNLGLANVALTFADPNGSNLAGVQLAYSSTTDADPVTPRWVPEAPM